MEDFKAESLVCSADERAGRIQQVLQFENDNEKPGRRQITIRRMNSTKLEWDILIRAVLALSLVRFQEAPGGKKKNAPLQRLNAFQIAFFLFWLRLQVGISASVALSEIRVSQQKPVTVGPSRVSGRNAFRLFSFVFPSSKSPSVPVEPASKSG